MLPKCPRLSALLQDSFSRSCPICVSPVAELHFSPHPTGKPGRGAVAALSLQRAKRCWVPAAGGMLWQQSLGGLPGPQAAGETLLTGVPGDLSACRGHSRMHRARGSPGHELPSISSPSPRVLHPMNSLASHITAAQASWGQGGSPGSSQNFRGGTRSCQQHRTARLGCPTPQNPPGPGAVPDPPAKPPWDARSSAEPQPGQAVNV